MYIVFAHVNIIKFQLLCTNDDTIDLLQDNNIKIKWWGKKVRYIFGVMGILIN